MINLIIDNVTPGVVHMSYKLYSSIYVLQSSYRPNTFTLYTELFIMHNQSKDIIENWKRKLKRGDPIGNKQEMMFFFLLLIFLPWGRLFGDQYMVWCFRHDRNIFYIYVWSDIHQKENLHLIHSLCFYLSIMGVR